MICGQQIPVGETTTERYRGVSFNLIFLPLEMVFQRGRREWGQASRTASQLASLPQLRQTHSQIPLSFWVLTEVLGVGV